MFKLNIKNILKRFITGFVLCFFILLSNNALANQMASVNTSALILRESTSTKSQALIAIPQGERVKVISLKNDDWCQIKYKNYTGYVMRKYLIFNNPIDIDSETKNSVEIMAIPKSSNDGQSTEDIKKIQLTLKHKGYYNGIVDGIFGSGTESALKNFQQANGLVADGVAGAKTIEKLYTSSNAKNNYNTVSSLDQIDSLPKPCKPGDSGEDVIKIQQALQLMGYYKGKIDGVYGKATINAIKAVQKSNRLTIDGIAGNATINLLFGNNNSAIQTRNETNNINTNTSESSDTIRPGDSGPRVEQLQKLLSDAGYYNSSIDGSYGNETTKAVKSFQKSKGLKADGLAGIKTMELLKNNSYATENKSSNQSFVSNNVEIYTIEDIGDTPRTSKPGDSGEDVVKLQQALKLSGYLNSNIDGSYGNATINAVKQFQKSKGMSSDGIAGPSTIKHLFGSKAANADSYQSVLVHNANNVNQSNVNIIESIDEIGSAPNTTRPGDSGEDVVKLQQALSLLKLYKGAITGNYDTNTQNAVKKFQKKRGMNDDGIAGKTTIRILFGEPAANHNNSSSGSAGSSNKANNDNLLDGLSINDIDTPSNSVKPGQSGNDVKSLQQALSILGYYHGDINSKYDEATQNAVKRFQKKKGMNDDGVAGPATIRVLFGKKIQASKDIRKEKEDKNAVSSIADIGSIPQPSKPGYYNEDVKKLQQALKVLGYFNANIDGKYGESTKNAVAAFQKKKGMNDDGIAGKSTIKIIFGKNPQPEIKASKNKKADYKTEMLDWFKDGSRTIPKSAVFEVQDCKTGKIFKVKRWSGVNHYDVEPLTAEDTKIAKQVYGSFSWMRRAVLIKYNGHVYAASMNFNPHGTQTIKNNNFNGHFCIHTLGSKTHGSKKVDKEHQNMLKRALKYKW